jgi:hypothetical protein
VKSTHTSAGRKSEEDVGEAGPNRMKMRSSLGHECPLNYGYLVFKRGPYGVNLLQQYYNLVHSCAKFSASRICPASNKLGMPLNTIPSLLFAGLPKKLITSLKNTWYSNPGTSMQRVGRQISCLPYIRHVMQTIANDLQRVL